jgi:hypothetical protein
VSRLDQLFHRVGADISGPAGHQHVHPISFRFSPVPLFPDDTNPLNYTFEGLVLGLSSPGEPLPLACWSNLLGVCP